jgi:hypothetical protein
VPTLILVPMAIAPKAFARLASLAISVLAMTATGCGSTPTASPTPSDSISVLSCQDVIGSDVSPPSRSSIILGVVALPTGRALQANLESDPHATLFAKDGLFIHRGASFDVIVPDPWRGRLTVSWGSLAKPTGHLRVPGCRPTQRMPSSSRWDPTDNWLVYPGGYFVSQAACVSLVVRAGQTEHTVLIGIGTPCPGQSAPPLPA